MRAKKSLGQNFLRSQSALRAIVEAGNIKNTDTVLEIGPGKGALTEKLLEVAGHVFAVETDPDMIEILEEKFSEAKNLTLIHQDILSFDPNTLVRGSTSDRSYKVVANIPYYITGEILEKFLENGPQPERMVLLMQKEVVDRIMERDEKGSILSKSIRVFGEPKYIQKVPATAFTPTPKVDSAILAIENISKNRLEGVTPANFFSVLKTGFAHKRKKLIRNLEKISPKQDVERVFALLGIDEHIRPEKLTTKQWISLAKELL